MQHPESLFVPNVQAELALYFEEFFHRYDEELDAWLEKYGSKETPPAWVENAMGKLFFPYVQWLDGAGDLTPDLETFGKIVGGLQFSCEAGKNVKPLLAWSRRFGNPRAAKESLRPLREIIVSMHRNVRNILRKVHTYPTNETARFFTGYQVALKHNLIDERGKPVIKTSATTLHLFLVLSWKTVEQQRSFAELHLYLRRFFPRNVLGDLDRLKAVCKKIKLRVGKRGRPKKQKK